MKKRHAQLRECLEYIHDLETTIQHNKLAYESLKKQHLLISEQLKHHVALLEDEKKELMAEALLWQKRALTTENKKTVSSSSSSKSRRRSLSCGAVCTAHSDSSSHISIPCKGNKDTVIKKIVRSGSVAVTTDETRRELEKKLKDELDAVLSTLVEREQELDQAYEQIKLLTRTSRKNSLEDCMTYNLELQMKQSTTTEDTKKETEDEDKVLYNLFAKEGIKYLNVS